MSTPSPLHPRNESKSRLARADKALLFLARLATELATIQPLPSLLERVMLALHEETEFESCTLALIDERTPHTLTIRGASGLWAKSLGATLPRGKGPHATVMEKKIPLLIADMLQDPSGFRRGPKLRSGIYAPLVVSDRVIGVLSVNASAAKAFAEADLNLLTIVARYLAGVIEVARTREQLRSLAATDGLTGLANRPSFVHRLAAEITRSRRMNRELSVVVLDIDGFELFNSVHGHAMGDELLINVAHLLTRYIRGADVAARWGGDEFAVLLPETNTVDATKVIARFRAVKITVPQLQRATSYVALSSGLVTWPKDAHTPEGLLLEAHNRLIAMKSHAFGKISRHERRA